jgi:hypothetical protein
MDAKSARNKFLNSQLEKTNKKKKEKEIRQERNVGGGG